MLPDRVSNPGPLTYESGDLPIALRGLAADGVVSSNIYDMINVIILIFNQKNNTLSPS